jgi:hypothetical protein
MLPLLSATFFTSDSVHTFTVVAEAEYISPEAKLDVLAANSW